MAHKSSKSGFKFTGGPLPDIFGKSSSSKKIDDILQAKIFRNRRIAGGLGLLAAMAFFASKRPRESSNHRNPRPVGRPRSKRHVGRPKSKRRVGRPSLKRR